MSFLKISDPVKRDLIVKEYLELKKNIRDNVLSERTGEQELQTDLSKFYRPITKTQKATMREITEGLRPIKQGIENLPQAIKFPPIQLLREESEEAASKEAPEKEEPLNLGEIADNYLNKKIKYAHDETFGINKRKDGYYTMGVIKDKDGKVVKENEKILTIANNNIMLDNEIFKGTPGLLELIMKRHPDDHNYNRKDLDNYGRLMVKINALHQDFNPNNTYPRSSDGTKWKNLLSYIWANKRKYKGKGVVIMSSDPNALVKRLDLSLASQEAGHTGVRNELVSICDELKRQGVLDTKAYKNLISNIKNDTT